MGDGAALLLLSEWILVHFHLVHMFAIVPTLFLNSGIIGFFMKKQKWNWYQNGVDNGVMVGIGIILLYGLVSVPYNFHRVGHDAIIYLLNSLAMVIAGMFFYPVVIRLFLLVQVRFPRLLRQFLRMPFHFRLVFALKTWHKKGVLVALHNSVLFT